MKEVILLTVALLLAAVLLPVGFLFELIVKWKKGKKYLYRIALSIDQLGNVVCAELFNRTLITSSEDVFGNEDEVISSVLGKNKLSGRLTGIGKALVWLLDTIDKNHTEKAIE